MRHDFRQILGNLVGNAVKFTEQGGIRISVRCDAVNGSDRMLSITVADTGIGISGNRWSGSSNRLPKAIRRPRGRFGGTGLGLAISQRLAKMLGGRIEVESTPGRGSSFCVAVFPEPSNRSTGCGARPPRHAAKNPLPRATVTGPQGRSSWLRIRSMCRT